MHEDHRLTAAAGVQVPEAHTRQIGVGLAG
jgi:hypothetical protein